MIEQQQTTRYSIAYSTCIPNHQIIYAHILVYVQNNLFLAFRLIIRQSSTKRQTQLNGRVISFSYLCYEFSCQTHRLLFRLSSINKGQFALFIRRRSNKGTKRKQWMRKKRGRLALILTQKCDLNCDRTRKKRALTDNVPKHLEFRRVKSSREKRWELVRAIRIKDFSLGNRISLGVR